MLCEQGSNLCVVRVRQLVNSRKVYSAARSTSTPSASCSTTKPFVSKQTVSKQKVRTRWKLSPTTRRRLRRREEGEGEEVVVVSVVKEEEEEERGELASRARLTRHSSLLRKFL